MSGKATVFFDHAGFPGALVLANKGGKEKLILNRGASTLEKPDYIGSDILRTIDWVLRRMRE